MFNWDQQRLLINIHDRYHRLDTPFDPYFNNYLDSSCNICYPTPNYPSDQFQVFWNWFTFISSANQFSRITTKIFDQYIQTFHHPIHLHTVDRLLGSIRYQRPEDRDTLVNQIHNCAQYTHLFIQNLDNILNLRNLEDYNNTDTENSDHEEEIPPGLIEDFNMNNNDNARTLLQLVQNIGERLAIQNNKPMPTFLGGMQDPMEWLEDFERYATINQYTNAYKLQVVGGYLLNEAQTWYQRIVNDGANNFQSWNTANNRNFKNMFLTQFRTQGKLLQWRTELQNRVQVVGETVDHYAQDIKRLIKRVDHQEHWNEQDKIYQFTKGLRRKITFQVRPLLAFRQNATLEQVIEVARQMDKNNRDYPEALMGFGGATTNPPPVTQNYPAPQDNVEAAVAKALAPLLQALGGLSITTPNTPVIPPTQGNNNYNNYNNNRQGNRPPRKSPTCYKCGQLGHIVRNCPTQQQNNNFQQPSPNNQGNTTP